VASLFAVWSYYAIADLYGGYRFLYGGGLWDIPATEIVHLFWFGATGTVAALCLAAAFTYSSGPEKWQAIWARACTKPGHWVALGTAALFVLIVVFQEAVLLRTPICDDESTYVFITQTLLRGRLVNPSPGDIEFFRNQFIILDANTWWGKYPIGHPLLLAAGELVGLRHLVVPIVTCIAFAVTYQVGKRAFDVKTALFAAALLLLSPQFVFSGATHLSQPASCLFMLLGMWSLLKLDDGAKPQFAALAGAALGFGVLVRPLPGALFVVAAALYVAFGLSVPLRRRVLLLAAGVVPVLGFAAIFLLINRAQTGSIAETGYSAFHGFTGFDVGANAKLAGSIWGNLLRLNFWALGWPLLFVFPLFARGPRVRLLWLFIAAALVYRVIVPKTVVATTGPVYLLEIVPLVCLLVASGLIHLRDLLRDHGLVTAARFCPSFALASIIVSLTCFVPVHIRRIHESSENHARVENALESQSATPALVFADAMVVPRSFVSWAYYPPPPEPGLDEPIIYVRSAHGPDAGEKNYEFWQRRFRDRRAFFYDPTKGMWEVKTAADFR
jgi:hypothetical protein